MTQDIRFSRPVAAAERLGLEAADRHRLLDKSVLLTGEPAVLATANGRACFLNSLQLLFRICPDVSVLLPAESLDLRAICSSEVGRLAFGRPITFVGATEVKDWDRFDAILSVGTRGCADRPWTVINSQGWLARISSSSTDLPSNCDQANPLGALAAAALGTADVFKRLIQLRPNRGRLLDGMSFSLFTYRIGTLEPGPPLSPSIALNLVMVGAGAIGNGLAILLRELPICGRVSIVDPQVFEPENLATCAMIGPQDVGKPKARVLAESLPRSIYVQPYTEELDVFVSRLGTDIPFPRVILGAVDNIDARHEIQRLWADLTIDGAIGNFSCQVSRHPWDGDNACLMCLFQRPASELAEQIGSRLTGLPVERVRQSLSPLTAEDILSLPEQKQQDLRPWVGRQVCAVVTHMVAQHLSEEGQRDGFEPSVPFAACFSATMMMAELLKHLTSASTPLETRFQLDMLRGPAFGQMVPQARRPDCLCVTRRRNIEKVLEARARFKSVTGSAEDGLS